MDRSYASHEIGGRKNETEKKPTQQLSTYITNWKKVSTTRRCTSQIFFFWKETVVLLLRNYHIYRNGNCLSGAKLKKNTVTLHFPPFAAAVKNAKKVPSKGTF